MTFAQPQMKAPPDLQVLGLQLVLVIDIHSKHSYTLQKLVFPCGQVQHHSLAHGLGYVQFVLHRVQQPGGFAITTFCNPNSARASVELAEAALTTKFLRVIASPNDLTMLSITIPSFCLHDSSGAVW